MLIVVIGLGEVGRHLLRVLEPEGHDIIAVDNDPHSVAYVEEHHDVQTYRGYAASERVLTEARAGEADLVVAATDDDEVNLVAALTAQHLGAGRTVARVQGNEWAHIKSGVRYGFLGVDVIVHPRVLVAQELAKIARSHGALEVLEFANDKIEFVQVIIEARAQADHRPLRELSLPHSTLVAAVVRDGTLFVPNGDDVLEAQDRVYVVGRPKDLSQAEDVFTSAREAHRVFIVGGGVTGAATAKAMAQDGAKVVLVESDRARAEALSERLDRVVVLHGDGTDRRLLEEEEVATFDLFVAATRDDELNLMAALMAKRLEHPDGPSAVSHLRTAAVVHRPDYSAIYRELGIDIVVSPRAVASDHILRFCRRTELQSLAVLENGQAVVLEMSAQADAPAVGRPIREVKLPRGALVAAVVHDEEVLVPRGERVIHSGDSVIVLCLSRVRAEIEALFQGTGD